MKKQKWHKVFVPEGGCEFLDTIENDPMVNWEKEPGYILTTMVALFEKTTFLDLIASYDILWERFDGVVKEHGEDLWVDLCKVKIKKVWEDIPDLYVKMLKQVKETDPHFQLGYCTLDGAVKFVIMGNSSKDISKALARQNLDISVEHAMYIGRELQSLESCLEHGLIYVQD
jgi:hypothetical protein